MIEGGPLVQDAYYGNPKNRWSVCTNECPQVFSRIERPGACNAQKETINGTCTWYSESPTTKVLGKYCIAGLASTAHTDPTGVVCSSAQQAIADVHTEAKRSFYDLGNMSSNDIQFLKTRVPEHQLWVVLAIEKSIQEDATKYAQALDAVAKQANEQQIVEVCTDTVAKQESTVVSFVTDVLNSYLVLIYSTLACLFFGLLYLLSVCKFVKPVVWGSLAVAIIGFSLSGYFLWNQSIQVKDSGLLEEGQEEQVLAIICWIFAAVLIVVTFFCRRALQLAIGISETTSGFLVNNLGMMLLPQLIAVFELCWLAYWMTALAAILSTATVKPAADLTQEIQRFEIDNFIIAVLFCHCYMGLWVHFFFEGLAAVTSSITVTDWYFKPKVKGRKGSSTWAVFRSLLVAVFYHLGSIAFGSGILPIAVILQGLIWFFQKTGNALGKDTFVVKIFCCCLSCCARCLASGLKFVSTNAYIMVGVTSKSFCPSAFEVFSVMARNPRRFVIFKGVMWTVDVACRFLLIGLTMGIAALCLENKVSPAAKSPWPAMLAVVVIAYFISGLISSVFTTSGSALFFCFVIDEEISAQTGRDFTLYAPNGLQGMIDAEVKKSKTKDEEE